MKNIKVLVTGAKGFVGSAIVEFLKKEYTEVLTLENERIRRSDERQRDSGKAFTADITDREAVLRLEKIGVIDVIVHSAGLAHQFGETKREDFQKVNVAGTGNILELARKSGVRHFILISSVSVYGHSENKSKTRAKTRAKNGFDSNFAAFQSVDEEAPCMPGDFYAESKLDAENLARKFCQENGIRLTVLRLATVIGEEDRGNFLNLIRLIDREYFIWVGKGENRKSLVHREDVARACAAVLANETTESAIFNVSANFLSMRRIVEIVGGKLEKKIPKIFIPAAVVKFFFQLNSSFFNVGKIRRTEKKIVKWLADDVYSAEKIKREYGFEPQISAEKAVEREVEWYIANNRK